MLEHIKAPADFLKKLQGVINGKAGTILFFEVPNVLYTYQDLGIWDLIYEHCSYFSTSSLGYLFSSCGFEIYRLGKGFENQMVLIEALYAAGRDHNTEYAEPDDPEKIEKRALSFSDKYMSKIEH